MACKYELSYHLPAAITPRLSLIYVTFSKGFLLTNAYLWFETQFIAAALFTCATAVYQVFALIRYVSKTNKDLTRLMQSINYSDVSQSFISNLKGKGFEQLHAAFTEVIKEFKRAKLENEEH